VTRIEHEQRAWDVLYGSVTNVVQPARELPLVRVREPPGQPQGDDEAGDSPSSDDSLEDVQRQLDAMRIDPSPSELAAIKQVEAYVLVKERAKAKRQYVARTLDGESVPGVPGVVLTSQQPPRSEPARPATTAMRPARAVVSTSNRFLSLGHRSHAGLKR
jgi:hypothetical protein